MLLRILTAFHLAEPDSLKRALAAALGGLAVLVVNPLLASRGLPPVSDAALVGASTVLTGYLLQSGYRAAVAPAAEPKPPVAP